MDENNDSLLEDPIEIDFDELIRETPFAWHIRVAKIDVWLPKSITQMDEVKRIVTIPEWMALMKGLL